jgi:GNAT superfamily N-acetyltransferase
MTPPLRVALVTPAQHDALVDLLCELHAHYHPAAGVAREAVRAHLQQQLLAPGTPLQLLVAARAEGGELLGFVAVALLYSLVDPAPELSRQCLVKELFVRAGQRSQGVGRALMAGAARWAVAQGCSRMDWNVQSGNARGMAFYRSIGAAQVAERLAFRLPADALRRLADDQAVG